VNDLPATTDSEFKHILCARDTSITNAYPDLEYLQNIMNYISQTKANGLKPINWH
jgi:hypothetical protein